MKSPLLRGETEHDPAGQRGCFVRSLVWMWNWLTTRKSKECAETVMRIKNVMNMLELASQNSMAQAKGKRQQLERLLLRTKGSGPGTSSGAMTTEQRSLAHSMISTAKKYEAQANQWLQMREVAENLKIELVSKQQTMGVYEAFAQTNAAMERMAQTVNTDSVDVLMTSIQNQIDEGKSVSQIFANGITTTSSLSEDDLDNELDALLRSNRSSTLSAPEIVPEATAVAMVDETVTLPPPLPPQKKVVAKKSAVL
jgi:hypothetical protein